MPERRAAEIAELANEQGAPAEIRHAAIERLVAERGFARVGELSDLFGVSTVTIRSDLDLLARRGEIRRVHGGAVARTVARSERPFELSLRDLVVEKGDIGARAAAIVSSGDSVILDVGTTTTAIARALVARDDLTDLTVFTSGLNIALELEPAIPRFTVVVTGGTLRPMQHSLVQPLASLVYERIRVDTAFVGCNGIDPDSGVTNINLPEAEVKQAMLHAARRRVVVADGSKVGEVELAKICDASDVSLLVTDRSADADVLAELAARGVEVDVA